MSSADSSPPASIAARMVRPVAALLSSIWERPILYWGFLVPLSVTVLEQSEGLVTGVPPIVPITAIFLLLAVLKGGTRQAVSTWQASPVALWLYVTVCAIEVFLMLYHRIPRGWAWVAGRVAFVLVMGATVANCGHVNDARDNRWRAVLATNWRPALAREPWIC